jgi:hypothetical protein
MEWVITCFVFADGEATEPEVKVVIKAAQFATSPPEY